LDNPSTKQKYKKFNILINNIFIYSPKNNPNSLFILIIFSLFYLLLLLLGGLGKE
jgi:hypothetical protein